VPRRHQVFRSNITDILEVMTVATVFVSNRFLNAHAYLRDSAICVRICAISSRVRSPSAGDLDDPCRVQLTIRSALRQAQLRTDDIQVVEAQHSAISDVREALSTALSAQAQGPSASFESLVGTNGFASLRGLGTLPFRSLRRTTDRRMAQYGN